MNPENNSGTMRLFHVSEDPDVKIFHPRLPRRAELNPNVGLVWTLTEPSFPNWLFPRECPRVGYRICDKTTNEDKEKFFSSFANHSVHLPAANAPSAADFFPLHSVHLPAANAPSAADFFPLHVVAVEHDWHERQLKATLHVYEFEPTNFYFDEVAGFYVSQQSETPINMVTYSNLYNELFKRNVEVRLLKNLWGLRDAVFASSMTLWSFCKMANAKPRDEK